MLRLRLHPDNPQGRHITRAADILRGGGLAVYPTDTTYGLGCDIHSKRSMDRIYQLKGMGKAHRLSFLCTDMSEVALYANVDNHAYRILKQHLPGKYTFVLPATRLVPKLLQSKTRTVGIRIPEDPVCQALLAELGHPIVSTTVPRAPRDDHDLVTYHTDPDMIADHLKRSIDVLLDAGMRTGEPSTVIDLCGEEPEVLREGSGNVSWLTT